MTSVITRTYADDVDILKRLVTAIDKHTPEPHEHIVVDNSRDHHGSRWANGRGRCRCRCRCLSLPAGCSYDTSVNAGCGASTGDILIFADTDSVVRGPWLPEMLACFEDPRVGLAGDVWNGHCQGGFCGVRRTCWQDVGLDGSFDVGMSARAVGAGWTLASCPVVWSPRGQSHAGPPPKTKTVVHPRKTARRWDATYYRANHEHILPR